LPQFLIRERTAKLLSAEIDPRDAITVGTVTERTLTGVQAGAGLNVGGAVLMVLSLCAESSGSAYDDKDADHPEGQFSESV